MTIVAAGRASYYFRRVMGLKSGEKQMSMIIPNVEELVSKDHVYRQLVKVTNWSELSKPLRNLYSKEGRKGYPVEQGFKILFLQFLEDRSDRQMEQLLKDSLAAKYFCNFGLTDKTPDHSYLGKFRERIGIYQLANIFRRLTDSVRKAGLIRGLLYRQTPGVPAAILALHSV